MICRGRGFRRIAVRPDVSPLGCCGPPSRPNPQRGFFRYFPRSWCRASVNLGLHSADETSPMTRRLGRPSLTFLVGLVGCFGLSAASLTGSRTLVYDEVPYVLDTVTLLRDTGLNETFLRAYPYPAGLSNCVLLWVLEPLFGIQPPGVRLLNLLLLVVLLGVSGSLLRTSGNPQPWSGAMLVLANPITWVLAGLALTEMLAMTATLAAFGVFRGFGPRPAEGSVWRGSVSGVLFGIAVLSRPQYLVLAPLPLLVAAASRGGGRWLKTGAFFLAVVAVCGPVVVAWGDIVSPVTQRDNYSHAAVSLHHLVLASGYASVMVLLLAPMWFRVGRGRGGYLMAGVITSLLMCNLLTGAIEVTPARGVVQRALPSESVPHYSRLCGGLLIGFAAYFWAATAARMRELWFDSRVEFVSALAGAVLVLSTVKITHQFSSRYVAVAVPFFVLATARYRGPRSWEAGRLALGSVFGFVVLRSYFP